MVFYALLTQGGFEAATITKMDGSRELGFIKRESSAKLSERIVYKKDLKEDTDNLTASKVISFHITGESGSHELILISK